MRSPRRGRSQRGVALSSPLAALSVAAVVLAGVAFVATDGDRTGDRTDDRTRDRAGAASGPATGVTSSPTGSARPSPRPSKAAARPAVRRGETYVEVFNNSGISGLAGSVAARAQGAGWQVVGSDNWYGTIDASTVYYPPRLQRQATLLGRDLGIARLKPAIDPMRGDRLTVILTGDYA